MLLTEEEAKKKRCPYRHGTGADCIAEGCTPEYLLRQNWFKWLWDDINAKRPGYSLAENPWVWSIAFKRGPQ